MLLHNVLHSQRQTGTHTQLASAVFYLADSPVDSVTSASSAVVPENFFSQSSSDQTEEMA